MTYIKLATPRRRPELFYCALIFIATIFISFVLVDLPYPFPESVISGDPWWRNNHRIVIVTVIDNVNFSNVDTVNLKDGNDNITTSSDYFKEMSVQNKISYAEKYGYELVVKTIKDWDQEASWAKIPALLETMKEYPNADWLWWMNSKIFISNPSISLSSNVLHNLTRSYDDKQILIGYDCHGLNAESFLIRNSPWSRKFLKAVYNPGLFKDFKDEETAMQFLINVEAIEVGSKILFVPLRALNALPLNRNCGNDDEYKWRKDDFVVNLAGCETIPKDCKERLDEVTKRTDIKINNLKI